MISLVWPYDIHFADTWSILISWCSFVLASYARFLWDAEDDEEEEQEVKDQYGTERNDLPSKFFQQAHWPPLAAAS